MARYLLFGLPKKNLVHLYILNTQPSIPAPATVCRNRHLTTTPLHPHGRTAILSVSALNSLIQNKIASQYKKTKSTNTMRRTSKYLQKVNSSTKVVGTGEANHHSPTYGEEPCACKDNTPVSSAAACRQKASPQLNAPMPPKATTRPQQARAEGSRRGENHR